MNEAGLAIFTAKAMAPPLKYSTTLLVLDGEPIVGRGPFVMNTREEIPRINSTGGWGGLPLDL